MKEILLSFLFATFLSVSVQGKTCEGSAQISGSNPFHFAFENLRSFDYLNHAVAQLKAENPGSFVCYSAVIIYVNTQHYNEYLFEIEITRSPDAVPLKKIRLLFQDGPIQAYHNALGLPWIGLDNTKVNLVLSSLVFSKVATSYEHLSAKQSAIDIVRQTEYFNQAGTMVINSLSSIQFTGPESDHSYYLVTWLKAVTYGVAKDIILPQASLVEIDNYGKVSVIEDVSLFREVLQPLNQIVQQSKPSVTQFDAWVLQLKNFAAQF